MKAFEISYQVKYVQSSQPIDLVMRSFVYILSKTAVVAKDPVMIPDSTTSYPIEGGLTKLDVIPGGGGPAGVVMMERFQMK